MLSKATVKYIQSLQHKKFRDIEGCFIAEGPKLVPELLAAGDFACKNIYATPEWMLQQDETFLQNQGEKLIEIKDFELEKISGLTHANQVLAVFAKKEAGMSSTLHQKISLLLDDIQDPGNLGTIIRIADWFGITDIFCSAHCADMYNPKVVQSTMASLGRMHIHYCDVDAWAKAQTVPLYAATLHGAPLQEFGHLQEGIIVIGNESHGVRSSLLEVSKAQLTIPRQGAAESLNAAVATGIILYSLKF